MILLDSDTFTLLGYGRPGMADRLLRARAEGEVALPVFVRAQALRGRFDGLLKANTPEDVIRLQAMLTETETRLAEFRVVPFDATASEHFARLVKMKSLKKSGLADLLIACIALAHDATLVTRNTKDFQPIPNLKLENWADPKEVP
jgi:tRNA(fMet)-specific endonuclease VapC